MDELRPYLSNLGINVEQDTSIVDFVFEEAQRYLLYQEKNKKMMKENFSVIVNLLLPMVLRFFFIILNSILRKDTNMVFLDKTIVVRLP